MGMVFKNIEYMNGGCFENLSGTFVPKSIGRGPPGVQTRYDASKFYAKYHKILYIIEERCISL
jgi:hypothetical protein